MQGGNSGDSQIWTIVGLGETARNWQPLGHSIGINDAAKWGKPLDSLLVCNRPQQFRKDRLDTIVNSNPKNFYSHKANWAEYFPKWIKLNMVIWYGVLNPKQVYYTDSGPFIAITLAYTLGAKTIILWGVDFRNHSLFNDNNPGTKKEVELYLQLFKALKEKGVEVYLGKEGSVFDSYLEVYDKRSVFN